MKKKVVIGLTNPKSPVNVGSVLRAMGCFQADKLCYTGNRYRVAMQGNPDTQKVSEQLPVEHVEDILDALENDMQLVCIEFAEGATPLNEFEHPERVLYVFGPEDGSVDKAVVKKADATVYIPTVGSLNLAASVNVTLYDRQLKLQEILPGEALIKESRDNNNRLKA